MAASRQHDPAARARRGGHRHRDDRARSGARRGSWKSRRCGSAGRLDCRRPASGNWFVRASRSRQRPPRSMASTTRKVADAPAFARRLAGSARLFGERRADRPHGRLRPRRAQARMRARRHRHGRARARSIRGCWPRSPSPNLAGYHARQAGRLARRRDHRPPFRARRCARHGAHLLCAACRSCARAASARWPRPSEACRTLTDALDQQHRAAGSSVEAPARIDAERTLSRIDSYPYRHRVRDVMRAPAKFVAPARPLATRWPADEGAHLVGLRVAQCRPIGAGSHGGRDRHRHRARPAARDRRPRRAMHSTYRSSAS